MKRKGLETSEERPFKKIRHTEDMEASDINSLPSELHKQIGSYLDDRSKRQMRLANTAWFKLINYTDFCIWIPRASMMDAYVERLSRYTQQISLRFAKQQALPAEQFFKISRLTNLRSLKVRDTELDVTDWFKLTTLTNLEFFNTDTYFDRYPYELLESFPKLRELRTYRLNTAFEELACALEKLRYLENIKITIEAPDKVNLLSKIHAEHLTSLEMKSMNYEVLFSEADVDKFSNLKRLDWRNDLDEPLVFPIYKLTQLESLACNSYGHLQHIYLLTNLTQLTLYSDHEPNTDPLSALTNLKSLSTYLPRIQFDFLRSLPNLEELTFDGPDNEFLANIPHENSITKLDIIGQQCKSEYFTRFSRLHELRFGSGTLCPNLTESFKQLTQLQVMRAVIWSKTMEDVDFSPLVNLYELEISNVSPKVMSTLHAMTRLTSLIAKISEPTEDIKFLENMPLKKLSLDCYDIPDLLPLLVKMTTLESLRLILVEERDEELKGLSVLTNLTTLDITGKLTGEHLTALTSLQTITLNHCKTKPFYTRTSISQLLPNLLEYNGGQLSTWRGNYM